MKLQFLGYTYPYPLGTLHLVIPVDFMEDPVNTLPLIITELFGKDQYFNLSIFYLSYCLLP